ncbi:vanadium-dependent haloperoxidase [Adhaeribacter radiodurans]|uniref:Vanadium-dependent haloperoxidase n=1 Tax=Adhaeribacter radiodurans TaxID=2745197 RepID=A0A7L7L2F9_9BACT|nr:vanadium-dependent haloperoxidase [Adhaeribacter radiodurans]QMU26978.1 vanadium-dependent haloperoxidase [Adhaeribacter radiodurans]
MKQLTLLLFLTALLNAAVSKAGTPAYPAAARNYVQTVKKLTDIMVRDVTGPCAAARYYAYANLAAYEVQRQLANPANYVAYQGMLRDYPEIPVATPNQTIDVNFSSLYALLRMGEELLPSGYLLEEARKNLIDEAGSKYRLNKEIITNSTAYADLIVKQLMRYAAKDGYLKTTGYMRYTPLKEAQNWQPTPPGYLEAYEPYWGSLRPFLLDSAAQFKPLPAVPFNKQVGTPFYNLANEVYDVTRNLNQEQKNIANFWDCNPFFLVLQGHVSYGKKKISPGGHWMGITGIACMQKQLSLAETVRWHTVVGLTMSDAFISCWNEKYRSNRIRPETFINTQIDKDWRSLLQTPPFPEYTSGHSVVSSAVALVLTALAGENFAYNDTVEVEFGLPARKFSSFQQAAQEAAISRLYGGIHYRDAVDNGFIQGQQIGQFVLQKIKPDK